MSSIHFCVGRYNIKLYFVSLRKHLFLCQNTTPKLSTTVAKIAYIVLVILFLQKQKFFLEKLTYSIVYVEPPPQQYSTSSHITNHNSHQYNTGKASALKANSFST